MGILTGADQEHLGRVLKELPASGGLLPGVQPEGHNMEQVHRGICWDGGGSGLVVGV